MAECYAALGKLVEAAEAYRDVLSFNLAPGAPAPFLDAQKLARTELPAIEGRLGSMTISVVPAQAKGLVVTLDGEPINAALVGVKRAVNPGAHVVHVEANDFRPVDRVVIAEERRDTDLRIPLVPLGSPTEGGFTESRDPTASKPASKLASTEGHDPRTVPSTPNEPLEAPSSSTPKARFFLEPKVALLGLAASTPRALSSSLQGVFWLSPVVSVGFGVFLTPEWSLKVAAETTVHGASSDEGPRNAYVRSLQAVGRYRWDNLRIPVLLEGGLGYRVQKYAWTNVQVPDGVGDEVHVDHGLEASLGAGVAFRLSRSVEVVPGFQVGLGSTRAESYDQESRWLEYQFLQVGLAVPLGLSR
jgi:hypothetical protein